MIDKNNLSPNDKATLILSISAFDPDLHMYIINFKKLGNENMLLIGSRDEKLALTCRLNLDKNNDQNFEKLCDYYCDMVDDSEHSSQLAVLNYVLACLITDYLKNPDKAAHVDLKANQIKQLADTSNIGTKEKLALMSADQLLDRVLINIDSPIVRDLLAKNKDAKVGVFLPHDLLQAKTKAEKESISLVHQYPWVQNDDNRDYDDITNQGNAFLLTTALLDKRLDTNLTVEQSKHNTLTLNFVNAENNRDKHYFHNKTNRLLGANNFRRKLYKNILTHSNQEPNCDDLQYQIMSLAYQNSSVEDITSSMLMLKEILTHINLDRSIHSTVCAAIINLASMANLDIKGLPKFSEIKDGQQLEEMLALNMASSQFVEMVKVCIESAKNTTLPKDNQTEDNSQMKD